MPSASARVSPARTSSARSSPQARCRTRGRPPASSAAVASRDPRASATPPVTGRRGAPGPRRMCVRPASRRQRHARPPRPPSAAPSRRIGEGLPSRRRGTTSC
eukprot:1056131-Prymnesium_polylepis.1